MSSKHVSLTITWMVSRGFIHTEEASCNSLKIKLNEMMLQEHKTNREPTKKVNHQF